MGIVEGKIIDDEDVKDAFDKLAVLPSLYDLVEDLTARPFYYRDTIKYMVNNMPYSVAFETINGEKYLLSDINDALNKSITSE